MICVLSSEPIINATLLPFLFPLFLFFVGFIGVGAWVPRFAALYHQALLWSGPGLPLEPIHSIRFCLMRAWELAITFLAHPTAQPHSSWVTNSISLILWDGQHGLAMLDLTTAFLFLLMNWLPQVVVWVVLHSFRELGIYFWADHCLEKGQWAIVNPSCLPAWAGRTLSSLFQAAHWAE